MVERADADPAKTQECRPATGKSPPAAAPRCCHAQCCCAQCCRRAAAPVLWWPALGVALEKAAALAASEEARAPRCSASHSVARMEPRRRETMQPSVTQSVITTLLPTEHMVHVYTHSVYTKPRNFTFTVQSLRKARPLDRSTLAPRLLRARFTLGTLDSLGELFCFAAGSRARGDAG